MVLKAFKLGGLGSIYSKRVLSARVLAWVSYVHDHGQP